MLVLGIKTTDGPIHQLENGVKIGSVHLRQDGHGQVKLGFDFDEDIEIQRDVIYQKMLRENGNEA